MKKLAACILLALFTFTVMAPVPLEARRTNPQKEQRKAQKRQQKAMKNMTKQQRKAQKNPQKSQKQAMKQWKKNHTNQY